MQGLKRAPGCFLLEKTDIIRLEAPREKDARGFCSPDTKYLILGTTLHVATLITFALSISKISHI